MTIKRAISADLIGSVEDPVAALSSQGIEVLMEHPGWIEACNRIVFRSMGLHPDTHLGGDNTDKSDFYHQWMADKDYSLLDLIEDPALKKEIPDYLTEDDPQFQMYYELLAQLHSQVFAEMIASQKFRWSPRFTEQQAARATQNTYQTVNGESNRP